MIARIARIDDCQDCQKRKVERDFEFVCLCNDISFDHVLNNRMTDSSARFVALLMLIVLASWGRGQGQPVQHPRPVTRILFVFDASGSMADYWQSDSKFAIATSVFSSILDTLPVKPDLELALRVYGQNRVDGPPCVDSRLEVPFGPNNVGRIKAVLRSLRPKESTPIAYSLEQTAGDFTPCENCRNVVILITDGLEACGGDPCGISVKLQKQGIFLRPFIVGIGENMQAQFDCMGNYYNATREEDYQRALSTIVSTTLKSATAQINLLDHLGRPTQSNVHVTLSDRVTGSVKYSFIHTLNAKGLPDTLEVDPLITYDVVVQTIPPVRKEKVWIEPGRHTAVDIPIPQGYLTFIVEDKRAVSCIIRQEGRGEAIHVQPGDRQEKYLAGKYDITVLTVPRMNFNGVEIKPDQGIQLRVPAAGTITIVSSEPVDGCLYMEQTGNFLWVGNLRGDTIPEQFQLQPGNYRALYRYRSSGKTADSKQLGFHVESGQSQKVTL
jgi:Ca-activated chloride channel family protein